MTQFNATEYRIDRPTGECALTGKTLEPDEDYIATLVELTDEEIETAREEAKKAGKKPEEDSAASAGFRRVDVSESAWEAGQRPERMFSYWRTTVPQPNEKKKLFVDDTVLYNLLFRLSDAAQPQRLAFRFVLALILMRKKLLRYDGTVKIENEQGVEEQFWKVVGKVDLSKGPLGKWDSENEILVLDPQLDDEQVQQVTEQLGEILETEL